MKTKRFLAWVVAALMLLTGFALPGSVREASAATAPAESRDADGRCGDDLTWTFYPAAGELVITGSGAMYDFGPGDESPWIANGFAAGIRTVTLPKGLVSIGAYAFSGCTALESIVLPGKMKTIGAGAFGGCTGLKVVELPKSVARIDENAFDGCTELQSVRYQGKADDRVKIAIRPGNGRLLNAAWTYTKANIAALTIKTQPRSIKVDEGKIATFKAKAAGATMIIWEYRPVGEETWHDTGVVGESYAVMGSTLYDGCAYRCRVTNGSSVLYSSAATLTVKPVQLAIRTQPKTVKANADKTVTFKVKAVGATRLQWQYMQPGEGVWHDAPGADGESYSLTAKSCHDGLSVRCAAYNDRGGVVCSNAAKLCLNIRIARQPKAQKVAEGEYAAFTVDASGCTGLQWEYLASGARVWRDVENATGETCTVRASADLDGASFRCRLYNSSTEKYTSKAKLTVTPAKLAITGQPQSLTAVENCSASFTVTATGATGYRWQYRRPRETVWYDENGADALSATYTLTAAAQLDGCAYRCRVFNSRETLYSDPAILTVKPALSITGHPASVAVSAGQVAAFSVTARGATGYQWQYLAPGETLWNDVAGATAATYSVTAAAEMNGRAYRCRVTDGVSFLYSDPAALTVNDGSVQRAYRALVIGESSYSENELPGGVYNASTMAGMLQGLDNSFTVTTLTDASATDIRNGIISAFAGATDNDVSLFYYSGHGAASDSYYYLGALSPIDGSFITIAELAATLAEVKGRVIVILDSCHSGAAIGKGGGPDKDAPLEAYNRAVVDAFSGYTLSSGSGAEKYGDLAKSKFTVITSASYKEVCWSVSGGGFDGSIYSQGLFTSAFIRGMGCAYPDGAYSGAMPADANGDGTITLGEIYNYVYDLALEWTDECGVSAQHTKYYGDLNEVLFCR